MKSYSKAAAKRAEEEIKKLEEKGKQNINMDTLRYIYYMYLSIYTYLSIYRQQIQMTQKSKQYIRCSTPDAVVCRYSSNITTPRQEYITSNTGFAW